MCVQMIVLDLVGHRHVTYPIFPFLNPVKEAESEGVNPMHGCWQERSDSNLFASGTRRLLILHEPGHCQASIVCSLIGNSYC